MRELPAVVLLPAGSKMVSRNCKSIMNQDSEWTPPHTHDPNPHPPSEDPSFRLFVHNQTFRLTPDDLLGWPQESVADCYIISTGHGTSGPFTFGGVPLLKLIERFIQDAWTVVDVISADGFQAQLSGEALRQSADRPAILALSIDRRPLSRREGLVRLVVPRERDTALLQVKWVSEIRVS